MSAHWLDDQYDRQREDPVFWWIKAEGLRHAAELCWERYASAREKFQNDPKKYVRAKETLVDDMDLSHVYFFLSGMAVEAYLKGIVVGRDTDLFKDNTKEKKFYTHNSLELARLAGLDFDEDQRFLLGQLGHVVLWHGRYPTPKNKNDWIQYRDEEGRRVSPGTISPERQPKVECLFLRLFQEIDTIRHDTADDR